MRKIFKILIVILVAGIIAGTLVNVIQAFADTTTVDTVIASQITSKPVGTLTLGEQVHAACI